MKTTIAVAALTLFAAPFTLAESGMGKTKVPADDRTFVEEAASGGRMEVELGRLAEQKASDPQVKAFGRRMVEDHGKANERLRAVARTENIELSDALLPPHEAQVNRLSKLSGRDFDLQYTRLMHEDQVEDVRRA